MKKQEPVEEIILTRKNGRKYRKKWEKYYKNDLNY